MKNSKTNKQAKKDLDSITIQYTARKLLNSDQIMIKNLSDKTDIKNKTEYEHKRVKQKYFIFNK